MSETPADRRRIFQEGDRYCKLEPVSSWLERLQGTTLPPYNPRVQTKSAAKVLSDRLLPVGRHVLNLLKKELEGGVSEVDIW